MAIQQVESLKPKRSKRVTSHIEIHRSMDGGHVVKHVYRGYENEPKEYKFNKDGKSQGGEHVRDHVTKHAGLPDYSNKAHSITEERITSASEGPVD